jgi:hypothetical protein
MKDTSAPEPFDQKPAFDYLHQEELKVQYQGNEHTIVIKFSVTKAEPRAKGGNSLIGRHAARNQGVSIVRALRELELNRSFDSRSDPVHRWFGVEVLFDPGLDDVFGVTNNKQAATLFTKLNLDEDAKIEGISSSEYRERLKADNDPHLVIYDLSAKISNTIDNVLIPQIKRMREGTRTQGKYGPAPGSAEDLATRATQRRREEVGDRGASDEGEKNPITQREQELEKELVEEGVPETDAKGIVAQVIPSNVKFLFQEAEIPGSFIFDVKSKAGVIIININTRHPARQHLFELLKQENVETDPPTLRALKLLLTAWARVEDEATSAPRRRQLEEMRQDWGKMAWDFLELLDE